MSTTNDIIPHEKALLSVIRMNASTPRLEWKRAWRLGRLEVKIWWRSSRNLWGRFGGGWNWKLGIQAGGRSAIISLLTLEVCFYIRQRDPGCTPPAPKIFVDSESPRSVPF